LWPAPSPAPVETQRCGAELDPALVSFGERLTCDNDAPFPDHPLSAPAPVEIGRAALRRAASDLALISYGAYVHVAMRVADALAKDGIEAAVLDLRTIAPLDRETVLRVARHCGKVMIVHEDSRTGGIGESVAAIIQEEAFEFLDAPIRIIGALDTPVPYSPPLEDVFLPDEVEIEAAARTLAAY
jgi:2-oxoisovalerate dehydrogenase E1 component beta subunit